MGRTMNRKNFLKLGAAGLGAAGIGSTGTAKASPVAEQPTGDGEFLVKIAGRDYCWNAVIQNGRLTALSRALEAHTKLWLTRGLVDIQVNGYAGIEVTAENSNTADLASCEQSLADTGMVRWCPTVTSQSSGVIEHSLATIDKAVNMGALRRVQCIHLEANYLNPEEGYRGAHPPQYLTNPDKTEFTRWQKAAGGRIGYVTMAPEIEGGLEFVSWLASQGILVSMGHHNADYETVVKAADAGARLSTHLFNGCKATLNRHHNVVLNQLAEDRLWASFIPDGHHIPYHTLKVGLRAKGLEHAVFTSDLVSLGGSPEGEYVSEGLDVLIRDGGAFLKGTPYLYGAWANLAQGVERATAAGVVTSSEAIRLASTNPARLLRMDDSLEVEVGATAPFVLFREQDGALKLDSIVG